MPGEPILTWEQLGARGESLNGPSGELLQEIIAALRPATGPDRAVEGRDWFLAELEVGGFIGIGHPPVRLQFPPEPGLTVIAARNGVGKSSLAWGLRHLLGGTPITKDVDEDLGVSWRNLHTPDRRVRAMFRERTSQAEVALLDDGPGPRLVTRGGGTQAVPTAWTQAKAMFEPVLIYSEIAAAMDDDREVNDAWVKALALEVLQATFAASEGLQREHKAAATDLRRGRKEVWDDADPPSRALLPMESALGSWDPAPLVDHVAALRGRPSAAALPPVADSLAGDLLELADVVERLAGTRAAAGARQQQLAALYRLALQQEPSDPDPCPLCGSTERHWRDHVRARQGLPEEADEHRGVRERFAQLRDALLAALPVRIVDAVTHADYLVPRARDVEDLWNAARRRLTNWQVDDLSTGDVEALRRDIEAAAAGHQALGADLQRQAAEPRDDPRVLADRLDRFVMIWARDHEQWQRHKAATDLSAWLREPIKEARDLRSGELGQATIEHFGELCPDGGAVLERYLPRGGVSKQQRMETRVRLGEGEGGVELLSTGQRNALCLAAFLPRTLRPENPFKFIVLDDPVQAFDGGRVAYVAEVLAEIAEHHQVVVLTHDERLPNVLRNSGHRFTHIQLERGPRSALSVERVESPADALLDDASEVANNDRPELDDAALAVASLALCRQAVDEALSAAHGRLRARRPELSIHEKLKGDTVRDRQRSLNVVLQRAGLARIDIDGDLLDALNGGSHFDPPTEMGKAQRLDWVRRSRGVVAGLDELGQRSR